MPSGLRLRVFAGPNGSGKSMMYDQVKDTLVDGRTINLGTYLNPDILAKALGSTGQLDLQAQFGFTTRRTSLVRSHEVQVYCAKASKKPSCNQGTRLMAPFSPC